MLKFLLVAFGIVSLLNSCVADPLVLVECQKCTAISRISSNEMYGYVTIGGRSEIWRTVKGWKSSG